MCILLVIIIIIPAHADIMPPGMKSFDRCVKISNIEEFPDVVFIGYITGPVIRCENPYVITSDECLTQFYKANDLTIYAVDRDYLDTVGLENIYFETDPNIRGYTLEFNPDWDYAIIVNPLVEEEIYYSIAGFNDTELILYESKKISKYVGLPDRTEIFEKSEVNDLRLTINSSLPDSQENFSDMSKSNNFNEDLDLSSPFETETAQSSILDEVVCYFKNLLGTVRG